MKLIDVSGDGRRSVKKYVFILILLLLLGLVYLFFLWLEGRISPGFRDCISAEYNSQGANASHLPFARDFMTENTCSLYLVDRHNGSFALLSTIAVAFFTGTLWTATRQQVILTRESIELARKEFNASNRPKLRVRNVVMRPPNIRDPLSQPFDPLNLIHGQFYISNTGNAAARIVEGHAEIWTHDGDRLPMDRPYEGKPGNIQSQILVEAGSSAPMTMANDSFLPDQEMSVRIKTGVQRIYVMGWLEYLDASLVRRRMAFCRKYDASLSRFVPVDNPDYEHEE